MPRERAGRSGGRRYESVIALALIAALAWLAQFHHFRDFGLYEDDYWFISEAMGKNVDYLQRRFVTAFTTLPQGRPLGFLSARPVLVRRRQARRLARHLPGRLLRSSRSTRFCVTDLLRTRVPIAPAVVGAAVFCLFPSDTTKILLTHDFQLQPSLTFALLAALAYASGRKPGLRLSVGALLSYENGFLALFALPLFTRASGTVA